MRNMPPLPELRQLHVQRCPMIARILCRLFGHKPNNDWRCKRCGCKFDVHISVS